jgi:hypothetical protein
VYKENVAMRRTASWYLGLLVLVFVVNGCQPLKKERTIQLESSGVHRVDIDKPNHVQDVTVETEAENAEIDAYLVLEKNADVVERKLLAHEQPDKALLLDSQLKKKNATLTAKIPAQEAYTVFLTSQKNTSVKYTITGK